jgi:hypothetical protein
MFCRSLFVIVHGFHGEENDIWISLMTSALLKEVVFMLSIGIQLFNGDNGNLPSALIYGNALLKQPISL